MSTYVYNYVRDDISIKFNEVDIFLKKKKLQLTKNKRFQLIIIRLKSR